jgi:hypothetical protein
MTMKSSLTNPSDPLNGYLASKNKFGPGASVSNPFVARQGIEYIDPFGTPCLKPAQPNPVTAPLPLLDLLLRAEEKHLDDLNESTRITDGKVKNIKRQIGLRLAELVRDGAMAPNGLAVVGDRGYGFASEIGDGRENVTHKPLAFVRR